MKIQKEIITARTNPTVKMLASLSDKKGREENRMFIAEGFKLTLEAAEAGLGVSYVILSEEKRGEYQERLLEAFSSPRFENTVLTIVSESVFSKISTEKAPQGVMCAIKHLDFFNKLDIIYKEDFFLLPAERAILLCSVRDPANLGAVIRSSVAFGAEHIILTDDCADVYNPKTVRAAMGALFRVKITSIKDISTFVASAKEKNRRIFAAELTDRARPLSEVALEASDIFIIGNEGHGIPESISLLSTASVYIPISKATESLNAAVAASIFMWEQSKV